jgi:mannobiose 2-epimerase
MMMTLRQLSWFFDGPLLDAHQQTSRNTGVFMSEARDCLSLHAKLLFHTITVVGLVSCRPMLLVAQQDLADEIERSMHGEMTQYWYPAAVNAERGGFHQTFSHDWTRRSDNNASLVAQARHTWTCAAFALYAPDHRSAYTVYAKDGIAFVERAFTDTEHGGLYWAVGADGRANADVGYDKHVYGTAFAIYAAAKVYELTHDSATLAFASRTFDWLEEFAHDDANRGYFESLDRTGTPIVSFAPNAPAWQRTDQIGTMLGFKSMNTHIHVLEAFTELARFDTRPIVRQRLQEVFELVRDRIAVEPGVLCLFFTPDWRATAAHDSFGHDIETAYLLIEAAHVLGIPDDTKTWKTARDLVDHALQWGWDAEHGGFYDKGEAFSPALDTDKVWWVQAEGLNALAVMHAKFGKETDVYRQALEKQWQFIRDHSIDHQHGGWHSETNRQGHAEPSDKANAWKTNYHTARSMMNSVKLLKVLSP